MSRDKRQYRLLQSSAYELENANAKCQAQHDGLIISTDLFNLSDVPIIFCMDGDKLVLSVTKIVDDIDDMLITGESPIGLQFIASFNKRF